MSSLHMGHLRSAVRMRKKLEWLQGNLHAGHSAQSMRAMRLPVGAGLQQRVSQELHATLLTCV